jgi:hypothetical protein
MAKEQRLKIKKYLREDCHKILGCLKLIKQPIAVWRKHIHAQIFLLHLLKSWDNFYSTTIRSMFMSVGVFDIDAKLESVKQLKKDQHKNEKSQETITLDKYEFKNIRKFV